MEIPQELHESIAREALSNEWKIILFGPVHVDMWINTYTHADVSGCEHVLFFGRSTPVARRAFAMGVGSRILGDEGEK